MKLSELSTDRALDALCELTPYVANIASDEVVAEAVGKFIGTDDDADKDIDIYGKGLMFMGRIGKIIPILLKTHRGDVYGILSVINERPVSEIAAQNLMETMAQVRELFRDEEFAAFFKSSARQAQNAQSEPSADSPA